MEEPLLTGPGNGIQEGGQARGPWIQWFLDFSLNPDILNYFNSFNILWYSSPWGHFLEGSGFTYLRFKSNWAKVKKISR